MMQNAKLNTAAQDQIATKAAARADSVFVTLLGEYGLDFSERGVWIVVGKAEGSYGWKLHLSSIQIEAPELLRAVLPILAGSAVPFKIARNSTVLGLLNEGALGATQVGKFVTIYPPDTEHARKLARELIAISKMFSGPRIVSDRHLGGVVYTRYGPFNPRMHRNRLGLFEPADQQEAEAADYRVPFAAPAGNLDPFPDMGIPAPHENDTTVRPIGPGYLITDVLAHHAKGNVYLAIDVRDKQSLRTVILKEGRMHCMSDPIGRAMAERIANQARAHARAANLGIVPIAHPPFSFGNSIFLPMDYIDGQDLGARPATPFYRLAHNEQAQLLKTLGKAACAVQGLHDAGIIHRDLSMRNIRVGDDGAVYLLDLEIAQMVPEFATGAHANLACPPLMQGTPGFVSPQQLEGAAASVTDDVFALGAVLLCALTGLDPKRVIFAQSGMNRDAQTSQLAALSGAPLPLVRAVAACVAESADERPAIAELIDVLEASACALTAVHPPPSLAGAMPFSELVDEGAKWLIEGAARDDATGMWKSPDIEAHHHADIALVHGYRVYRSANVGVAGVVYTLSKLLRHNFQAEGTQAQIERAIDWLLQHQNTPDDQLAGLHFGETGVALAIAEAIAAKLIKPGRWTSQYFREVFTAPIDWPDLTHGAAGQGLGALACAALLAGHPDIVDSALACVERCVEYLCAEQAEDGSWVLPQGVVAMSGKAYTGLAHGTAGILAFLSHPAVFERNRLARTAAARAAHWLLSNARAGERGLYLWWPMTPDERDGWSWWCHGGPGIAVGLLAYFHATGDARCAAAVRAALRAHPFEARHANLSQCHGLAGIGEIYLDAYERLQETEWLERAYAIGRLLSNLARRGEHGASWLVENPYVPTPDLMIGTAGIVHFLARLTRLDEDFNAPLLPSMKNFLLCESH